MQKKEKGEGERKKRKWEERIELKGEVESKYWGEREGERK